MATVVGIGHRRSRPGSRMCQSPWPPSAAHEASRPRRNARRSAVRRSGARSPSLDHRIVHLGCFAIPHGGQWLCILPCAPLLSDTQGRQRPSQVQSVGDCGSGRPPGDVGRRSDLEITESGMTATATGSAPGLLASRPSFRPRPSANWVSLPPRLPVSAMPHNVEIEAGRRVQRETPTNRI